MTERNEDKTMTQAAELPLPSTRAAETRLVSSVCFAHFVSHYYILLLAPLFIFVREDYGVSYTELGLALTAFNVVSTVVQTPVGFLVDRWSARYMLVAGLLVGAAAFAIAGLVNSFWVFVAMFALAGPRQHGLSPGRLRAARAARSGRARRAACSRTTPSPACSATRRRRRRSSICYAVMGWRGAFLCAAALGVVAAIVVFLTHEPPEPVEARRQEEGRDRPTPRLDGWRLLLSAPILPISCSSSCSRCRAAGSTTISWSTLGALHGTPATVANTALTGLLAMSAVGVLVGGSSPASPRATV